MSKFLFSRQYECLIVFFCKFKLEIWFGTENYTAVGCAFTIYSIDSILEKFHAIIFLINRCHVSKMLAQYFVDAV